jgi:dienelactone hydrolase
MVPVTIEGEAVKLAVITHKPAGDGPFPVLIFHHGSTGWGTDPSLFAKPFDPAVLADWFVARGWAVVLPARRGRGGSEGLYDEGFAEDRSKGYTCEQQRSLAGAEHALRDIDAATGAILALPFVDRARFVVGGQSRGGILAIAWAGRHPDQPQAAINFVGGWMGAGCPTAAAINQSLLNSGAAFRQPSIWFYGDRDPYYPLAHTRANFAAFEAAGGKGSFHEYEPPQDANGHQIIGFPKLWGAAVEAYLAERGLPAKERQQ